MKIAVLYNDDKVVVEFSPEKFRDLLEKYLKEYKSIKKAMDKIVSDLKKELART